MHKEPLTGSSKPSGALFGMALLWKPQISPALLCLHSGSRKEVLRSKQEEHRVVKRCPGLLHFHPAFENTVSRPAPFPSCLWKHGFQACSISILPLKTRFCTEGKWSCIGNRSLPLASGVSLDKSLPLALASSSENEWQSLPHSCCEDQRQQAGEVLSRGLAQSKHQWSPSSLTLVGEMGLNPDGLPVRPSTEQASWRRQGQVANAPSLLSCGSFSKDASCYFCSHIFCQTLRLGAMSPNSAHYRPVFLSCFTVTSCHVCFPHLVCITWVYESGFTQTLGPREIFLELWVQEVHNKHFLQGGCGMEWGAKWKKRKEKKNPTKVLGEALLLS